MHCLSVKFILSIHRWNTVRVTHFYLLLPVYAVECEEGFYLASNKTCVQSWVVNQFSCEICAYFLIIILSVWCCICDSIVFPHVSLQFPSFGLALFFLKSLFHYSVFTSLLSQTLQTDILLVNQLWNLCPQSRIIMKEYGAISCKPSSPMVTLSVRSPLATPLCSLCVLSLGFNNPPILSPVAIQNQAMPKLYNLESEEWENRLWSWIRCGTIGHCISLILEDDYSCCYNR